ncbi:MAG: type II toxin-antitoxin system VapC family toxin [Campylobacterales bacterium]|nr:type II toxin-antitoxin system VapC family toxin [Campylobacterales bacterium]
MKKIFLDANILIDIADDARPHSKESAKLFSYLIQNSKDFKLYTSCDLITTIYYLLKKPLGKTKSLEQLKIMNSIIHIIEFGNQEIDEAIYLMEKDANFGDLEDTIQFVMARKERCDSIITNDQQFHSYEVPLLSSAEALEAIKSL